MTRETQGAVLCAISATAFGGLAIFGRLAYDHGATPGTLLLVRFGLAGAVLWLIVAARRVPRPDRRTVAGGVLLGAGYTVQAGFFFAALEHIDASLLSLLLYTYPAMVFVAAVGLGRERPTARTIGALALAVGGAVLVLAGGGPGALNATGVGFAIAAALTYTAYILVADGVVGDADPFLLTALITTTAAVLLAVIVPSLGGLDLEVDAGGWLAIAGLALISTVVAASAFLLGLERVGPSAASIISTFEPVVTVALAAVLFGERLGPTQLFGAAMVLAAVVVLQVRGARVAPRGAPDHAAAAAPAGAAPREPPGR